MELGKLSFDPVRDELELVGVPVADFLHAHDDVQMGVSAIDASLADTAAFCEHYEIGLEVSANCVIVEARRGDTTWYAACMVLATTRADVNGAIRKYLDARKLSFAPMDTAVNLSGMEYGGITPVGLPEDWPILVDERVAAESQLIIGSGIRGSKLLVSGATLAALPGAVTLDIVKPA